MSVRFRLLMLVPAAEDDQDSRTEADWTEVAEVGGQHVVAAPKDTTEGPESAMPICLQLTRLPHNPDAPA